MTLSRKLRLPAGMTQFVFMAVLCAAANAASAQPCTCSGVSGVSGDGYAALVDNGGIVTRAGEVLLPGQGGIALGDLDAIGLGTSVTSGWANTVTTGAMGVQTVSAQTVSSLENVSILGGLITAKFVNAVASSTSNGTQSSSNTLGSVLTDLVVNGVPVGIGDVVPAPNTRMELPGLGYVLLNEQSSAGDGITTSGVSVKMIHVVLLDALTGAKTGEIIVGSASSAATF